MQEVWVFNSVKARTISFLTRVTLEHHHHIPPVPPIHPISPINSLYSQSIVDPNPADHKRYPGGLPSTFFLLSLLK